MTTDLLPSWPGWHRMPPPIEVRWSRGAWEALYPLGCTGWKPWPWEPEARPYGEWPTWPEILEMVRKPAAPPLSWDQLRTITEAHEAAEAVWMHGTPGL